LIIIIIIIIINFFPSGLNSRWP